ncbi:MAG: hypothetical protein JWQ14_566 [Adhaeribacter sp.]|nr:hypothetical protein [Adhaeribacter sp.]
MVLDTLENADKYAGLHRNFAKAFEFIKSVDLETIEVGKYPIDGLEVHAAVMVKDGGPAETAKFEAHRNYIDIQVCPTGSEELGWKPLNKCHSPKDEYNPEKDVTFYNDKPDTYFKMTAGQFAIFYPEDVHAPLIGEGQIKKLVVKIKV